MHNSNCLCYCNILGAMQGSSGFVVSCSRLHSFVVSMTSSLSPRAKACPSKPSIDHYRPTLSPKVYPTYIYIYIYIYIHTYTYIMYVYLRFDSINYSPRFRLFGGLGQSQSMNPNAFLGKAPLGFRAPSGLSRSGMLL